MTTQHPARPRATTEAVYFTATGRVLGTHSQREREASMARLVGTGKAPDGQYVKGQVFDAPEDGELYNHVIAAGWAKPVAPEDDPARSERAIAEEMVRGGGPVD